LKIKELDEKKGWYFFCPGCNSLHSIDRTWTFDGNLESPTIHPSLLTAYKKSGAQEVYKKCHLFVTDGKIIYLGDSTHRLSGQTIAMMDLED
jgi:Family of unknown function (DUF6527)